MFFTQLFGPAFVLFGVVLVVCLVALVVTIVWGRMADRRQQ